MASRQATAAKRVVRNGAPTNDLVLSAYVAANDAVFPKIMDLYVRPGRVVADVTFGKGVFWQNIPSDKYHLLASDIADGVDCRDLPYQAETIDCVVLDPPYMHSPGGTAHSGHSPYEITTGTTEPATEQGANITKRSWNCTQRREPRLTVY